MNVLKISAKGGSDLSFFEENLLGSGVLRLKSKGLCKQNFFSHFWAVPYEKNLVTVMLA